MVGNSSVTVFGVVQVRGDSSAGTCSRSCLAHQKSDSMANFAAANGHSVGSCGQAAPDPIGPAGLSDGSPMHLSMGPYGSPPRLDAGKPLGKTASRDLTLLNKAVPTPATI